MAEETPVANVPPKKRRSLGLRLLLHGYRFALIAAIALLVRVHSQHESQAALGPVEISLGKVQGFLPEASSLVAASDREGAYIHNAAGKRVGWAVTTLPTASNIIGFSGPTNSLIVVDADNTIRGVEILSSKDTPEHLAAVQKATWFLKQFTGKSPEDLGGQTKLDAVSGATLTSLAIIESVTKTLGSDPPNYRFPKDITLEEVAEILPEAKQLVAKTSPHGWLEVLDAEGKPIGTAWRTSPQADQHVGYQGPSDVLVVMDTEGKLKAATLRESYDNEPYVRYVREDWSFPEYLAGYGLDQLAKLDVKEAEIEGVSGATMTSQSATQAIGIAAAAYQREMQAEQKPEIAKTPVTFTWRDVATLLVISAALAIAFTDLRGKKWVQFGFGFIVIAYLGFFAGDILSMALFVGWASHPVPWQKCIGLVAVAIAAFAVPLFSKKQVYCNHLCPHGAAQMMILRFSKWSWKIPKKLRLVLSALPAVLLAACILIAFSIIDGNLAALEPFDAYVPTISGWASLSIAIGGLVFSAFVPMGFCRYACPTGAIISHVRWNASSDQWSVRDSVATLLLGLAVICFWV
ncbi:Electron transport complex subunit RsxG [Bremerella volcania]|uniref:Electron transport complex subunit RsxG n=1 Tax=Bremerella volcania TaxID=2527984 RepID=A0A518CEL8_9BACT|nr:FMN-binding protein [Bremerella volcania]QDU77624.1 Electron transport complex subunit RsxG [Bremerella volcania]